MNIGELKRRVKIWAFVEERDEFGGIGGEWKVIAERWAKVEQNSGNEITDNSQVQARVGTKIVLRYMPELTEKNRITYKDKIYEINSVLDVDSGHYMTITDCTELKDGI